MKKTIGTLMCGALLFSVSAWSETVAEKKMFDKSMEKINASVEYTAKQCGSKIEVKLDKGSFKGEDALKTANWCSSAIDAVGSICSDKDYKEAVTKAIKSVECSYNAALKSAESYGVSVKKSGSTLNVSYNKDSSNVNSQVSEFMKKNL